MATYTTQPMSGFKADEFISAFDSAVGTETETDDCGNGLFTVTCFELEGNEVAKCKRIEAKIDATPAVLK